MAKLKCMYSQMTRSYCINFVSQTICDHDTNTRIPLVNTYRFYGNTRLLNVYLTSYIGNNVSFNAVFRIGMQT